MNKRSFVAIIAFTLGIAHAQTSAPTQPKIALLSLIGNYFSVDVFRNKTGSNIRRNDITRFDLPAPLFDHTALASLEESIKNTYPRASIAMLAVPKPGTVQDPDALLEDRSKIARHPLVVALRDQGFGHLITITKLTANGRVPVIGSSLDPGKLTGLGFFMDPTTQITNMDTLKTGTGGYLAPYVHIKLSLIDTATGEVVREHKITTMETVTSADNASASDAWSTLTSESKVSMLRRMIRQELHDVAPQIVPRNALP